MTPSSQSKEEEIARIIDPSFSFWDEGPPNSFQQRRCNRALAKADAILALISNGTGEAGQSAEARFESARLAEKLSRIVLQMQRTGDWRLSEPEAENIIDTAKWLLALSSRTQAHE